MLVLIESHLLVALVQNTREKANTPDGGQMRADCPTHQISHQDLQDQQNLSIERTR